MAWDHSAFCQRVELPNKQGTRVDDAKRGRTQHFTAHTADLEHHTWFPK